MTHNDRIIVSHILLPKRERATSCRGDIIMRQPDFPTKKLYIKEVLASESPVNKKATVVT